MDKNRNDNIKQINRLLVAACAVVSVVVVIFVSIVLSSTNNMTNYINEVYEGLYASTLDVLKARSSFQDAHTMMFRVTGAPDYLDRDGAVELLDKNYAEVRTAMDDLEKRYGSERMAPLEGYIGEVDVVFREILDAAYSGDNAYAIEMLETREAPLYTAIDAELSAIIDAGAEDISSLVGQAVTQSAHTEDIVVVLGIVAVAVAVVACVFSAATISRRNTELYHRELLFNVITSNVDDVFTIYDVENRKVEYVSPNIERVLGVTKKTYTEKGPLAVSDGLQEGADMDTLFERVHKKGDLGEVMEIEYPFRHLMTGESKLLRTKIYPITKKDKGVIRLIGMTHDVTKDKKAQSRLTKALEEAERANRAKRDFLSRMGHEIRTPINAIVGMRTIAEMSLGDDVKLRDCLHKIDAASKHLLGLVNDILDMSQIEKGKMRVVYALFDLHEMIGDLRTVASQRAGEKEVELVVETENILYPNLFGDGMRIKQIVLNFLTNAMKFTPVGGEVKLRIDQYGEDAEGTVTRFAVQDTGPGIRAEFMDKLFEPFEQDDTVSAGYGGTGLGMAISKTLADLMGGELDVKTEQGKGSEFSFSLYLKAASTGAGDGDDAGTDEKFDFSGIRALVAEDNEINMEIMEELLAAVGIEVEQAFDGRQAVEMFEAAPEGYYDMVMMDIQMPVMKGDEAAKRIRSSKKAEGRDILIIAMTANEMRDGIILPISGSMNARLAKPINPRMMFKTIERLYELKQRDKGEKKDVGD